MSSYGTGDFSESIRELAVTEIESVLAAWGNVDNEGKCCDECGGEWSGGFLLKMKDGRFAYVTGWCDYTGWGCQDGVETTFYATQPDLKSLSDIPSTAWDLEPADLTIELERLVKSARTRRRR